MEDKDGKAFETVAKGYVSAIMLLITVYNESSEIHGFSEENREIIYQEIKTFCGLMEGVKIAPMIDGQVALRVDGMLADKHKLWT